MRVIFCLAVIFIAVIGIHRSVAARTVAVEDGLIGYWSFDKGTINGDTVMDLWGNQDAQMIGDIQIVTGKIGEAIQLPGGAGARVKITDDKNKAILPIEGATL